MSEGMVRIHSSYLTTSMLVSPRFDLSPTIAFITYLSFSVKIGKLKGARLRTRLAKISSNLYPG